MHKFIASLILPVLAALLVLWCSAGTAHAAEAPYAAQERALHAYVDSCHRQPLANGRPGESVTVCENVRSWSRVARPVASKARRAGVTTVVHYGHRAPVYSITYIAGDVTKG